jgi:Flp pilus assembly protein TadG
MIRRLVHLLRECAGTTAVEFALILPLIATLFCGGFEAANMVVVYLKVTNAADTVADLVAQAAVNQTLHAGDIDDFYKAGQLIMTPSPGSGLAVAVASVIFDPSTGAASVSWQQTRGGAAAMTDLPAAVTSLGLGGKGDSVVVGQASYTYNSVLRYVLPTPITFTQRVYVRPRLVPKVPYS